MPLSLNGLDHNGTHKIVIVTAESEAWDGQGRTVLRKLGQRYFLARTAPSFGSKRAGAAQTFNVESDSS
jgi:hypothetical protein